MSKKPEIHWGNWVQSRSEFIGFKRQSDLAKQVGCSRQQLSNWFALRLPPTQMRKGFDRTLARALQTTRDVLFSGFPNVLPEDAPAVVFHGKDASGTRSDPNVMLPVPTMLNELAAEMLPSELEKMIMYGLAIVAQKKDDRRARIEEITADFGYPVEILEEFNGLDVIMSLVGSRASHRKRIAEIDKNISHVFSSLSKGSNP
jgi:hypothetical protein